jgi:4-aminobutyrate aminotransferase-like enzyme
LASRAALTAINIVEEENLADNAARQGNTMMAELERMKEKHAGLGDVRGMGLAIGLEMVEDKKTKEPSPRLAKAVVQEAWKSGLAMIAPIGFYGNVIRIAPPLIINDDQVEEGLGILEEALAACH